MIDKSFNVCQKKSRFSNNNHTVKLTFRFVHDCSAKNPLSRCQYAYRCHLRFRRQPASQFFNKLYFLNCLPDETCFWFVTGGGIHNSWIVSNQPFFISNQMVSRFESNYFPFLIKLFSFRIKNRFELSFESRFESKDITISLRNGSVRAWTCMTRRIDSSKKTAPHSSSIISTPPRAPFGWLGKSAIFQKEVCMRRMQILLSLALREYCTGSICYRHRHLFFFGFSPQIKSVPREDCFWRTYPSP